MKPQFKRLQFLIEELRRIQKKIKNNTLTIEQHNLALTKANDRYIKEYPDCWYAKELLTNQTKD
jgi:hypothetical protein